MIFLAHPRVSFVLSIDASRHSRVSLPRAARVAARLGAALAVLAGLAWSLPAAGQVQGQGAVVRDEFRTSPRALVVGTIDRSRTVQTLGAVSRAVASAQDVGRRDPAAAMESMQLVLRRPQERQAAFDAEVEALHQRGSPSYHQWLTPTTVGTEFGPVAADIATLREYLEAEGFIVNHW